jgi:hypothetical protein
MGCDIHLCVEQKDEAGKWQRLLPPPEARDHWLVEQAAKVADSSYYLKRAEVVWYGDRNYDAFAILADVRNGRGFAGIRTGAGFIPIAEPRGLPDDLSDGVRRLLSEDRPEDDNDIWMGDHSHSWLLASELIAYDWTRMTTSAGILAPAEFTRWYNEQRMQGSPKSWCGGISGKGIVILEQTAAAEKLRKGESLADKEFEQEEYVSCEWPITYSEAAGSFHKQFLPALVKLGRPDETRIVFGFDS